jgi:hypothetical protein
MDLHHCLGHDLAYRIIRSTPLFTPSPPYSKKKKKEKKKRKKKAQAYSDNAGWFFIPDLPAHRTAWYLNAEEKEHAAARLGSPRKQSWDLTVFKRVLWSWQFYLLPFIFMR